MTIVSPAGYTLPANDQPLTHARILHRRNWLTGGTITASSTATDFFATAPDNSLTYEFWQPSTTGFETWEFDNGSAIECDCAAIAAHDLATQAVTVSIQYFNGSTWADLVTAFAPTDDSPIMAIFEPITAQRWRIGITTAGSTPGKIAVIRFGKLLQMERPIYGGHAPLLFGRRTEFNTNTSETGEFLGMSKQRTMLSTSFEWPHVTAAWVRSNWPAMQRAAEDDAIFIAWRPEDFEEVGFGRVTGTPSASNMGIRDLMTVGFSLQAHSHD